MADPLFRTILCADWAREAPGRAVARADVARPSVAIEPEPRAGWDVAAVLGRAQKLSREAGPVLVGFDAPIGVPRSYLRAATRDVPGWSSSRTFVDWLLVANATPGFFEEMSDSDAWSVHRPFFRIPGGKGSRGRWEARLESLGIRALREIDGLTGAKPAFVVSGIPGSVGSAARDLWQGLLPFLVEEHRRIAVWPFDGTLPTLAARRVVVGEIYPRAAYAVALSDVERASRPPEYLHKNNASARESALARLRKAQWVQKHAVRFRGHDLAQAQGSPDAFDALMAAAALLRCVLEDEPLSSFSDREAEGGILGSGAVPLGHQPEVKRQPKATVLPSGSRSSASRCPIPRCAYKLRRGRGGLGRPRRQSSAPSSLVPKGG